LAAWYAGSMGLPINKLICASNANNVLTDFIKTGTYDRNRNFTWTISPSMDILISSNLERLLFEIAGHDANKIRGWMDSLQRQGRYTVDDKARQILQAKFWADYSSDDETQETIKMVWQRHKYLLDTHTAVAVNVYEKYLTATGDKTPVVVASTASPFKFGISVAEALFKITNNDEFAILQELADYTKNSIPPAIKQLPEKPIRHQTVCTKEQMADTLLSLLGLPPE